MKFHTFTSFSSLKLILVQILFSLVRDANGSDSPMTLAQARHNHETGMDVRKVPGLNKIHKWQKAQVSAYHIIKLPSNIIVEKLVSQDWNARSCSFCVDKERYSEAKGASVIPLNLFYGKRKTKTTLSFDLLSNTFDSESRGEETFSVQCLATQAGIKPIMEGQTHIKLQFISKNSKKRKQLPLFKLLKFVKPIADRIQEEHNNMLKSKQDSKPVLVTEDLVQQEAKLTEQVTKTASKVESSTSSSSEIEYSSSKKFPADGIEMNEDASFRISGEQDWVIKNIDFELMQHSGTKEEVSHFEGKIWVLTDSVHNAKEIKEIHFEPSQTVSKNHLEVSVNGFHQIIVGFLTKLVYNRNHKSEMLQGQRLIHKDYDMTKHQFRFSKHSLKNKMVQLTSPVHLTLSASQEPKTPFEKLSASFGGR